MTETRKEIIRLIEPYMDKTLSEGCLYFYLEEKQFFIVRDIQYMSSVLSDKLKSCYLVNTYGFRTNKNNCKILGHYDITAVLKYIQEKGDELDWTLGDEWIEFSKNDTQDMIYFYIVKGYSNTENGEEIMDCIDNGIPNKPLHLYTEQEEKDLLELLKKLGQTT